MRALHVLVTALTTSFALAYFQQSRVASSAGISIDDSSPTAVARPTPHAFAGVPEADDLIARKGVQDLLPAVKENESFATSEPPPEPKSLSVLPPFEPSTRRKTVFITLLAVMTGFSDVLCSRRYDYFANMMTGNTIRFALSLSKSKWADVLYFGAMTSAYAMGVVLYRMLDIKLHENTSETTSKTTKSLTTLALLSPLSLVGFVLADVVGQLLPGKWFLPLLSITFGMVNAGVLESSGAVTNAVTGHIHKFGMGFTDHLVLGTRTKGTRTSLGFVGAFVATLTICSPIYDWVEKNPALGSLLPPMGTTFGVLYALLLGWFTAPVGLPLLRSYAKKVDPRLEAWLKDPVNELRVVSPIPTP